MTVFEPGSSDIGSDRSANCATTTAHLLHLFKSTLISWKIFTNQRTANRYISSWSTCKKYFKSIQNFAFFTRLYFPHYLIVFSLSICCILWGPLRNGPVFHLLIFRSKNFRLFNYFSNDGVKISPTSCWLDSKRKTMMNNHNIWWKLMKVCLWRTFE